MTSKQKTVYFCDHCNKHYLHKGHAKRHEDLCFKNPDNFTPCLECKFLQKRNVGVYYDYFDGCGFDSKPTTKSLFYCGKKNHWLHLPQNVKKDLVIPMEDIGDGETENLPMPGACEEYVPDDHLIELETNKILSGIVGI